MSIDLGSCYRATRDWIDQGPDRYTLGQVVRAQGLTFEDGTLRVMLETVGYEGLYTHFPVLLFAALFEPCPPYALEPPHITPAGRVASKRSGA